MTGPAMASRTATRPAPWAFAAPWGARGYVTDIDGPVHWIEFGPGEDSGPPRPVAQDEPPIVFVHGLGGSHLNWCLIGPRLGRRAIALDLHGFGLTPGRRATSTVQRNARLLEKFVREVTGAPVILVGNSMGGLISIMQTAAAPDTVSGLVLIDPALPPPRRAPDRQVAGQFLLYALPGLGEFYVRKCCPGRRNWPSSALSSSASPTRPGPTRPCSPRRSRWPPSARVSPYGPGTRPFWPRPGR